jgi:GT2 family glycosyltransferase
VAKLNPIFDIVVSTAGRFDMLTLCLDAIYANATFPITITVVDDATKREEKLRYRHLFEYQKEKDVHNNVVSFNTMRNEIQAGFGGSYNKGARNSRAPYLTILNDDVVINPGYFEGILKVMQDETIGIVGARLLFPETSTSRNRPAGKIQHVGVALDVRGNAVHPLIGWSADNPKTMISREALAVTGALMTIRSKIFRSLGGFDPIYGLGYWEDLDLCLKVRQKGGRIWFESSVGGVHYANSTTEKNPNAFGGQFQQNAMTFRARWANSGFLVFDLWSYG